MICDAHVHAPVAPSASWAPGINMVQLLAEMDGAGVDRCVIIPLDGPVGSNPAANNAAALGFAKARPDRFAVMGRFDLSEPALGETLTRWTSTPGMRGVRVSFTRDPAKSLLASRDIDWFWQAAERHQVPVMAYAPGQTHALADVAARHPLLELMVDHAGLDVHATYDDFRGPLRELSELAELSNVAVKASCLPCVVREDPPFPTLQRVLAHLVETFGSERIIWGTNLTRLRCTYSDAVELISVHCRFLSERDRALILGYNVLRRLKWP